MLVHYQMSNWKDSRRAYRQFLAEGNLRSARDALQMAIEQITGPDMLELAGLFNQLAKLNLELCDPSSAENAARRAIDAEVQFGPSVAESDRLGAHSIMLADALRQQGKYSDALLAVDRGIELFAQHLEASDELLQRLKNLRVKIEDERWRG